MAPHRCGFSWIFEKSTFPANLKTFSHRGQSFFRHTKPAQPSRNPGKFTRIPDRLPGIRVNLPGFQVNETYPGKFTRISGQEKSQRATKKDSESPNLRPARPGTNNFHAKVKGLSTKRKGIRPEKQPLRPVDISRNRPRLTQLANLALKTRDLLLWPNYPNIKILAAILEVLFYFI